MKKFIVSSFSPLGFSEPFMCLEEQKDLIRLVEILFDSPKEFDEEEEDFLYRIQAEHNGIDGKYYMIWDIDKQKCVFGV